MSDTHIMILIAERRGVCKKRGGCALTRVRSNAPMGKELRRVGGCPLVVGVVIAHLFPSTQENESPSVGDSKRLPFIKRGSIPS